MEAKLYEYAIRNKLRFASVKGLLSIEDLWDVPLRASKDGFDLNAVAQTVNKALKVATEENFVETRATPQQARYEIALEIVKHVIRVRLEEEEEDKRRAAAREEKRKLLEILAKKQDGKLDALSEEDIRQRIAALPV